jgi:hypothetical protein
MVEWKRIGDIGLVSVEVDLDAGTILIRDNTGVNAFVFNVIDAAHLAILLDEAVAAARGDGVKLDKDLG